MGFGVTFCNFLFLSTELSLPGEGGGTYRHETRPLLVSILIILIIALWLGMVVQSPKHALVMLAEQSIEELPQCMAIEGCVFTTHSNAVCLLHQMTRVHNTFGAISGPRLFAGTWRTRAMTP
jgi:hypothetical protein